MMNETNVTQSDKEETSHDQYPTELEDAIRSGRAVVATDASMEGNLMASH